MFQIQWIRNGETKGSAFQLFMFHQKYCPVTVFCVCIYLLAGLSLRQPNLPAKNSVITNEDLETESLRNNLYVCYAENPATFRLLDKVQFKTN